MIRAATRLNQVVSKSWMPERRGPYRVILWAPGMAGQLALREMLRRPEFEIVGCLAYNPAKAGTDVAALIGLPPIGVPITTDKEAVYRLPADIVVYAGRAMPDDSGRLEEISRLLSSGKNVVTITDYFFPWQKGGPSAARLEAACAAGGSTLHGTGVHPGWFMERLVLTMTSLCSRLDAIEVSEVVDMSHHSGESVRNIGYGMTPERLGRKTRKQILSRYYYDSIAGTAHRLGVELDRITAEVSYPVAARRLELPTVVVEPGTVAAVDGRWIGYADGRPFITMREFWYMDPGLADFTEITSPDFYDVTLYGRPVNVRNRIDLEVTEESDIFGRDNRQVGAKLTTAVQLVNTVPSVVAAPPGILLPDVFAHPSADLRDIVAPLARRPAPVPEVLL
jgi:2,4-diaminopentanoate dehydrogenase